MKGGGGHKLVDIQGKGEIVLLERKGGRGFQGLNQSRF